MLSLYLKYKNLKDRFLNDEEGQGLVEYVLIIILIALAVLVALNPVAIALQTAFNTISSTITASS